MNEVLFVVNRGGIEHISFKKSFLWLHHRHDEANILVTNCTVRLVAMYCMFPIPRLLSTDGRSS